MQRVLPRPPAPPYFHADRSGHQFGLTDGRWKYILDASAGHERLHDLAADPLELHNLAKQQADVVKQLRAAPARTSRPRKRT